MLGAVPPPLRVLTYLAVRSRTAVALVAIACLTWPASGIAAKTERVSVSSSGEQGNGRSGGDGRIAVSASGRFVAFWSEASNLVAGDRNRAADVFVRDRRRRTTTLVSLSSSGAQMAGPSSSLAMSDDGRYLAFIAEVPAPRAFDYSFSREVFWRDLVAGTTVHVGASAERDPSGAYGLLSMSADGRFLLFATGRPLVPEDTDLDVDVYLQDLARES